MLDPFLRPVKDRLLAGPARLLSGVHPNWVTGVSLLVGLAAALAAWRGPLWIALVAWLANRALDGLDGLVARIHHRASELGGYLDLMADFAVYALIPVGLVLRPGAPEGLARAVVLLLGAFYVNACSWMVLSAILERRERGAAAVGQVTTVVMPEGLVAGTETVIFYALFLAFPGRQILLVHLMAGLVALSALQRLIWGIRKLEARPGDAPRSGKPGDDASALRGSGSVDGDEAGEGPSPT